MRKLYLIIVGGLILGAIYTLFMMGGNKPLGVENGGGAVDPFNAIYLIEGRGVQLVDKYFEGEIAPNGTSKMKVSVFGEPVYGDLDKDGDEDALLVLAVDMGDGGTFYYSVVALNYPDGWRGTNAILIGDRIAPQVNQIKNNLAIVNYDIYKSDESMNDKPNISKTDYLYVLAGSLERANLKSQSIFLIRPQEDYKVFSPLKVSGYAKGIWFFEGDFPVILTGPDNKVIAKGIARTKSDWMTADFVPFEAVLNFKISNPAQGLNAVKNGLLILQKSGAADSDLPESLEVKVQL